MEGKHFRKEDQTKRERGARRGTGGEAEEESKGQSEGKHVPRSGRESPASRPARGWGPPRQGGAGAGVPGAGWAAAAAASTTWRGCPGPV